MSANVGSADRIIRLLIAVVAIAGAYFAGFGKPLGIGLTVVALIMVFTAAVRFCPLYRLVGASTCKAPAPRG